LRPILSRNSQLLQNESTTKLISKNPEKQKPRMVNEV